MKIECNNCGSENVFLEKKGNQTGIYCAECGKWIKWATKEEIRVIGHNQNNHNVDNTQEIIPMQDVREFVEWIQNIKDEYNSGNKNVLNYGLLCDLCIKGWRLVNNA